MTLLIGSEGSMGQRYKSILKHLGVSFDCWDLKVVPKYEIGHYHRFIVATPTDTHYNIVMGLSTYGKPILCEKPFSKNLYEVKDMLDVPCYIDQVMQYKYLVYAGDTGRSKYNYFRHGNDGLVWDCFQIVALANGSIDIAETSPIWTCAINGRNLNLSEMDSAYILQVQDFLREKPVDRLDIYRNHKKVKEYENLWNIKPLVL